MALALITGGSGGIGLAMAEQLAAQKTDLILTARSGSTLERIARDLSAKNGVQVIPVPLDLAKLDAPGELVDEIGRRGLEPGILINNAGYGSYGKFVESPVQEQLDMIRLNVNALVELTALLLPGMVARRSGRIMNVASTAAFQPGPLMAVYYATKAFVLHFSEAIDNELEGTGVTVTALCPGPTTSGFQERAAMTESRLVKGPMMDAATVARIGLEAMFAGKPVVIPGMLNRMVAFSTRLAPRSVTTRIARQVQEKA